MPNGTARPCESSSETIGRIRSSMPRIGRSLLSRSPLTSRPTVSLIGAPLMALTTVAKVSDRHGFQLPLAANTFLRLELNSP